jgi:hypothetical protein
MGINKNVGQARIIGGAGSSVSSPEMPTGAESLASSAPAVSGAGEKLSPVERAARDADFIKVKEPKELKTPIGTQVKVSTFQRMKAIQKKYGVTHGALINLAVDEYIAKNYPEVLPDLPPVV